MTVTISPSIKFMKVEDDGFDDLGDLDGMVSVKDNIALKDPALFKGIIDVKYLEAFLNATMPLIPKKSITMKILR